MNQVTRKTLFTIIFSICLLCSLFSQKQSLYEDWDRGFSLCYPAEWFIEQDYNIVSFCSTEESFSFEGQGVGMVIRADKIDEYKDGGQTARSALEEVIWDYDEYGDISLRMVAGEEWVYADAFDRDQDFYAEFYALVRQGYLYLIGVAYWPADNTESNRENVELMLDSFAFLEVKPEAESNSESGEKYYQDYDLGVSFSYPANWQLEQGPNQVMVTSSPSYNTDQGVIFVFMRGPAEDIGIYDTEELNEETVKDTFASLFGFEETSYISWLGKEWLYCVGEEESMESEILFYIHVESEILYLIIIAIGDPDSKQQNEQGLDLIMDSFQIEDFGY